MNDYYILIGLNRKEVKIINIRENNDGIIEVEIENKHNKVRCKNCNTFSDDKLNILKNNYFDEVEKLLPEDEILLIEDDSDINKEYSKKLEDLCVVGDASKQKETYVNGYHVCEIATLTKNEKQPISLYSHIYSTESKDFISCNNETIKSEEYVLNKLKNMLRWRIEEYFRAKKQNYNFKNFRIRSLKGINVLNTILTCLMLHNGMLAEK